MINLKVIIATFVAAIVMSAHAPSPEIIVKVTPKKDIEVLNAEHLNRQLENEKNCQDHEILRLSMLLAEK